MGAQVLIKHGDNMEGERTSGRVTGDIREARWNYVRGLLNIREVWVVFAMVLHESAVVHSLPVNTVVHDIINLFLKVRLDDTREPARAMFSDTKHEEVVRAGRALSLDVKLVSVPDIGPFVSVLVDGVKEEMMNEPYVGRVLCVQTIVVLECEEEGLPLAAEPDRHIEPESLNARVVYAPMRTSQLVHGSRGDKISH